MWNVYGDCENYATLKGHSGAVMELHYNTDGRSECFKMHFLWALGVGLVVNFVLVKLCHSLVFQLAVFSQHRQDRWCMGQRNRGEDQTPEGPHLVREHLLPGAPRAPTGLHR